MHTYLAALYNPALRDPAISGEGQSVEQGGVILGKFITNIVGMALVVAVLFFLTYLLTGGIQWITSGGDKAQLEAARNKITNAMIGLIIVAAAYAIFILVSQFLGLSTSATGPVQLIIPKFGG